jgi:hypothetical protein
MEMKPLSLMDFISLPYNQKLGIEPCSEPPHALMSLEKSHLPLNHLDAIQTTAISALAEAGSGLFLTQCLEKFGISGYVPTLRRSEIKFKAPATENLYAIGKLKEAQWLALETRYSKSGKGLITVPIYVMGEKGKCFAEATFHWFIFRIPQRQRRY